MGFLGVVGLIVEHVPFAIDMAQRFFGKSNGAAKKLAAGKEVIEFVGELVAKDPLDEWSEVDALDVKALLAAIEDEEEFVKKITDVNDAIVALANYIASKTPVEEA